MSRSSLPFAVYSSLALLLLSPGLAHAQQASATVEIAVSPPPPSPPPPPPPPQAVVARPERPKEKAAVPKPYQHEFGFIGLQGLTSWDRKERGYGGQVWLSNTELSSDTDRVLAMHGHTNIAAGYGQPHGFLGEARTATMVGPRLASGSDAPALLVGFEALALRTPTFFHSLVEVPQVSIAYHHITASQTIELGARLGYVAVGRYNPGKETRKLGDGGAFALYAASVWKRGSVELDYRAIRPLDGDPTRVVHIARLALCAGGPFSVCVNGMVLRGELVGKDRPETSALLGLSLGGNPPSSDAKDNP